MTHRKLFGALRWLDGRPLLDVIEPYRQRIFDAAFGGDYSMVVSGRGKKNWKSADLVLAALVRLLTGTDPQGSDACIIANDEGQAADDLDLAKKLVACNPILAAEVDVRQKSIERKDGRGALEILPARDVIGLHGKSRGFIGRDEIHGLRNYDLFEALSPDPTRPVLEWIASYATIYHRPGVPLFDLFQRGKAGTDKRMLFDWHAADYCTCPDGCEGKTQEERANPSMASWGNPGYLEQQRLRLPVHKFRRLHLNLPGMPEGAYLDPEAVQDAVVEGRRQLAPVDGVGYVAFVDMSGGSSDDAVLAIAHRSPDGAAVLDLVVSQTGQPPFDPRAAVEKFAALVKEYRCLVVHGDAYAGQTFRSDFNRHGIAYRVTPWKSASELFEQFEVLLNAGRVSLLDVPKLTEQALGLVAKTSRGGHPKIEAQRSEHDDWVNAVAGAVAHVLRYDAEGGATFAPDEPARAPYVIEVVDPARFDRNRTEPDWMEGESDRAWA